MPQASPEVHQQWKERILKQRKSGQGVDAWCRKNKVAPHSFRYWQEKFFPKSLERSSFKEITEPKQAHKIGLSLEFQGILIHLESFDALTLKQCLMALREISC